jgi:folate-binding protein YgfZ
MNPIWKNFLVAEKAIFDNDADIVFPLPVHESDKHIYPLAHLSVLTVEGLDAANFLQGQITCDINDITETKSSLGAICNPKGRAIAVFLLIKSADAFLMVLPKELLALVKERLQRYVLRSRVSLTDSSDQLCLIGLCDGVALPDIQLKNAFATSRKENIRVNFLGRELIVTMTDNAQMLWQEQIGFGFQPDHSAQWRYLDIISGIPWLTVATSEEFIPQMLNLDKLGGISFKKGCYTGQEIVARTHYLGKAKRAMFVAECANLAPPEANSTIIDGNTGMELGKVLYGQKRQNICKMLIVLHISDTNTYNLKLKNGNQEEIILINLPF